MNIIATQIDKANVEGIAGNGQPWPKYVNQIENFLIEDSGQKYE